MDIIDFKKLPLMGILRGVPPEAVFKTFEAAGEAGLKTVEITLNTAGAYNLIRKVREEFSPQINIGAGTVLTLDDTKKAIDCGATFIVMPVAKEDVIGYCRKNRIPVFPGALTPSEIYQAWQWGAAMVKVFPAGVFGPKYLSTVKGPFSDIELMPVGGVTKYNIAEYFRNGAAAVAFGASIFNLAEIEAGNFVTIKNKIKELVVSVKKILSGNGDNQ
ncbi:MAG: bifunctional 4-hydroxy-2-oxoglutarate aldolase/2-dehydro-3-deoxy-phosphogluconate aldolase [Candidatus Omnitrophota bacterium]